GLVTLLGTDCFVPTPALLSLVSAHAEPGDVEIRWFAPVGGVARATVYRNAAGEDWESLGEIAPDGSGILLYHDGKVRGGTRYGYRLGVTNGGREVFLGETWVDVPAGRLLALDGFRSNPIGADVSAAFSLPDGSPARLELFDVTGRRLAAREVGGLGAGSH